MLFQLLDIFLLWSRRCPGANRVDQILASFVKHGVNVDIRGDIGSKQKLMNFTSALRRQQAFKSSLSASADFSLLLRKSHEAVDHGFRVDVLAARLHIFFAEDENVRRDAVVRHHRLPLVLHGLEALRADLSLTCNAPIIFVETY